MGRMVTLTQTLTPLLLISDRHGDAVIPLLNKVNLCGERREGDTYTDIGTTVADIGQMLRPGK